MYYQNYNSDFMNETIQKVGCFFLSCVNASEIITHKEIDKKEINNLWDWCVKKNIIINNNIVASAKIINKCLEILKSKKRVYEIATKSYDGNIVFYQGVQEQHKKDCVYIQKIITTKDTTHFRNVDGNENIIFDSFKPTPKIKKVEYTIIYSVR